MSAPTAQYSAIREYLSEIPDDVISPAMLAYIANLSVVAGEAPNIARVIVKELDDQRHCLKLIASENFCSLATQLAMGNLFTDKYAEGYPGHRFYAGCANVDEVEAFACLQARLLFGAEHAFVQPHSGADANLIAFWAILSARVQAPALARLGEANPSDLSLADWNGIRALTGNQKLLGMDYYSGGHLTHGYRHNVSAQMFEAHAYGVNRETGLIDYAELEEQATRIRPLILLAGYSAYPRSINFRIMREIADKVGAVLMVDMAHFAGLVAGGVFQGDFNPIIHADIVTTTTHKTLRGPRGGMILSRGEFPEQVDKGCPLVMGGPLPHVMAAKGVALQEAGKPEFADYAHRIVANARSLASCLAQEGLEVVTGGTDNHLMLVNVSRLGLTGRQAESALRECGITLNRNSLPYDPNGPWYTSGLRIGTPAVTTLGMGEGEMGAIAGLIASILKEVKPKVGTKSDSKEISKARYEVNSQVQSRVRAGVKDLLASFPLYPELDLEFLKKHFIQS